MIGKTWLIALTVTGLMVFSTGDSRGAVRPFEGFRALVVEPENSWGWDSAILGALEDRGFEVAYGSIPEDSRPLSRYDLVGLSIKRRLTDTEAHNLKEYVAEGGAVYGSWGGPMATPGFLREVCKVGATRGVRIKEIALLKSPLTEGVPDEKITLAERAGHRRAGPSGWEIVRVEPIADGVPVAKDPAGNVLGVLSQYGKGRTAVLGFGPEQEKYYAKPELGPLMLDNLLGWLLEEKLNSGARTWSSRIAVALPARSQILAVHVNGERISDPEVKQVGSLNKVQLDVRHVRESEEADIRITYKRLSRERNVETVIHLPWNTMRAAADSPARLAQYLASLNATVCMPLLRGGFGHAWYKGMPEDEHDDVLVKQYEGNFLADLIRECHQRGIKVMADVYFDNATPVREYPDVKRLNRQGEEVKDRYNRTQACFNNPRGQEHNLATVEHLLSNYDLDGVALDDNFELNKNDCYCEYCKDGFREYCESRGMTYEDPSAASEPAVRRHWRRYQCAATRSLVAKVRRIASAHGVPAGAWVGVGMDATHLREGLDFLGGMVYETPPRAARAPLSVLGDCGFICLLWAPDAPPQMIEREAREAVHAGCAAVGFWIRGEDGGYEMDPHRTEAMRRALGSVEQEWLDFYQDNMLGGDLRFVIVDGQVGAEQLTLRIRNTGKLVADRKAGQLDLSALKQPH